MAEIRRIGRTLMICASLVTLAACGDRLNLDNIGPSPSAKSEDRIETERRPKPDDRGVISYSSYDVVVAQRGDTVQSAAARIGTDADELARYNGLQTDTTLRPGEVLALPRRIDGSANPPNSQTVDITSLAGSALDRVDSESGAGNPSPAPAAIPTGPEPIRHQVVRGETAYSIARLYMVTVRSLADWNGLGPDLTVREGQYLLIPVAKEVTTTTLPDPNQTTIPGEGTQAPEPPSASTPLPEPEPEPEPVQSPAPVKETPAVTGGKLLMPVNGAIIRDYVKGKTDGIDIAAAAGTPVKAADSGTVAAITRDTDGVPILVLRHSGNLLTVYANIQDVKFDKGATVSRGQVIANVRDTSPSFLHFEVRQGFDSVDPIDFLN